ncbi:hypothetical protein CY35_09G077900 [Sphagnum magellanicum]|nr:hypothetical protein CY35_09G077900 [Sphagnum magellanicum]
MQPLRLEMRAATLAIARFPGRLHISSSSSDSLCTLFPRTFESLPCAVVISPSRSVSIGSRAVFAARRSQSGEEGREFRVFCRRGLQGIVNMAAATADTATTAVQPIEVLVKAASGEPDRLGDCPFSQRVLLTLEEKGIPYNAKYVDTANKPDWFLEANPEGKVPVIKYEGKWVADSDVITKILEETYPQTSLVTPEDKASIGSKIFSSFVKFLKSKDPSDGSEEALVEELKTLNEYLKTNGPFINGDKISAVDLSLAPKLYHLKVALAHYKNWSIPEDLNNLQNYIKLVHSRESFEKTKAPEYVVIKGWSKHVA